jgi:hypothetical protein
MIQQKMYSVIESVQMFCTMKSILTFFYFSELLELPVLLTGIIGMYQGIEISHPVYWILFWDLIVCFFCAGK